MSTYQPLPDGLRIQDSPIAGQGLFCHSDWMFVPGHRFGKARIERIYGDKRWSPTRFPLGAFINHSDTPNCVITEPDVNGFCYLEVGPTSVVHGSEELTVHYRLTEYQGTIL